ncbi:MAG: A/G-specific adenine glycosylase [Myxococcaceae bacterium]
MTIPNIARLRTPIGRWFRQRKRDLPWRRTKDPYAIWLSEVMCQQTQVATVIPYWERFMARFPTPRALANASLDDVLKLWKGLGYYSRARNLHRAARMIVERYEGVLPDTLEALRELPGFGRYTAGAVASIAFGQQAPILDGNAARVLSRLFAIDGVPGDKKREARLWKLAEAWAKGRAPGTLNQALMEFGALVCRPKQPACAKCPARSSCQAHRQGRVDELPTPRVRAAPTPLHFIGALVQRNGRILLGKRSSPGLFHGLWELPGVASERPWAKAHAARALKTLLGAGIRVGQERTTIRRVLTHRVLTISIHDVRLTKTPKPASPYGRFAWFTPAAAEQLEMSTAMARAFAAARSPKVLGS